MKENSSDILYKNVVTYRRIKTYVEAGGKGSEVTAVGKRA